MPDQQLETRIGMDLARRAYLYSILHAVFGGDCSPDFATNLFGAQTREMLAGEVAALSDEDLPIDAAHIPGKMDCSLDDCAKGALTCCDEHLDPSSDAAVALASEMEGDYAKLFQIPGEQYVHLWESPYVGTEQTLFQCSTLDVRAAYHAAGLKLQAEKQFPDDHIAAMLEYLSFMGSRAYEAYADGHDSKCRNALRDSKAFLEAHVLTWVNAFAQKVIEKDDRGLYAAFAQGLVMVSHIDAVQLDWLMGHIGE